MVEAGCGPPRTAFTTAFTSPPNPARAPPAAQRISALALPGGGGTPRKFFCRKLQKLISSPLPAKQGAPTFTQMQCGSSHTSRCVASASPSTSRQQEACPLPILGTAGCGGRHLSRTWCRPRPAPATARRRRLSAPWPSAPARVRACPPPHPAADAAHGSASPTRCLVRTPPPRQPLSAPHVYVASSENMLHDSSPSLTDRASTVGCGHDHKSADSPRDSCGDCTASGQSTNHSRQR